MIKDLDSDLYLKIVDAHEATRRAHDYSYKVPTPVLVRMALGRAQSILIHYVVKYAKTQQTELD